MRTRSNLDISEAPERRLRFHAALAECAQALLTSTGENRMYRAVEALLRATRATYAFVERNVVDPELGFCSQTVAKMADDPLDPALDDEYWDLVPWDRMPTTRSHLERGEPFLVIPAELEGAESGQYAGDPNPAASELNIPILVNGEWAGLIGFSHDDVVAEWTDEDLTLLTTAASMFGAFWERELASERMEHLVQSKDQLLATISHELRTPLTALVGFGHLLRDTAHDLSPEERGQFLSAIVAHSTDMTNIVADLLVAARADLDELPVTRVPVDLRAQAAQVVEAFDPANSSRIRLEDGRAIATGDPERVRQIIRNLLSNAVRYGGESVRLGVSEHEGMAILQVRDSGPPIPESKREKMFQPYQRAHEPTEAVDSLGLGLAISRQLARRMEGELEYRHDGASVFVLRLPLWGQA